MGHGSGFDIVTDFEIGEDIVVVHTLPGFGASFADLIIQKSEDDFGALVSYGNDTLFLAGVDASDLSDADFVI